MSDQLILSDADVLNRALAELPKGWNLNIDIEGGEVVITLTDWDGACNEERFHGNPSAQVLSALEYAAERGDMGLMGPVSESRKFQAHKGIEPPIPQGAQT